MGDGTRPEFRPSGRAKTRDGSPGLDVRCGGGFLEKQLGAPLLFVRDDSPYRRRLFCGRWGDGSHVASSATGEGERGDYCKNNGELAKALAVHASPRPTGRNVERRGKSPRPVRAGSWSLTGRGISFGLVAVGRDHLPAGPGAQGVEHRQARGFLQESNRSIAEQDVRPPGCWLWKANWP